MSSDTIGAQVISITEDEAEVFVALDPSRVLDTRTGIGADGAGRLDAGETINVQFGGVAGVPDAATSVAINTTIPASSTSAEGFFTLWPTGDARPSTSANNSNPGQPVPNFSLFRLGDGGALSVYLDAGQSHFVIDVVGYFLPLSEVEAGTVVGGDLISGSGAPAASLGDDGDAYVDTDTGQLYVKANGVFVATGTPTAVTDSAYGAFGTTSVDLAVADGEAIAFGTDGAVIGDAIERTDADTFTVNATGVYEVSYRVSTAAVSDLGSVQIEVDGTPVGPENTLALAGASLIDTITIEAEAGDTIELVEQMVDLLPLGLTLLAGDSTSITIKLIANT